MPELVGLETTLGTLYVLPTQQYLDIVTVNNSFPKTFFFLASIAIFI